MIFFSDNDIVHGLQKYPVLNYFSEASLRRLIRESELITLSANEILYHCHDASEHVFYLIEGHLEGFLSDDCAVKLLTVRAGELVGELDVIVDKKRIMTMKSLNESRLLKINKEMFATYFQKKPELFMILAQSMANRLLDTMLNKHNIRYEYRNIGLIALFPDAPIKAIMDVFHSQLLIDSIHLYDKNSFERSGQESVSFFNQCGAHSGLNVFVCEYGDDAWSKAVFNHVDYVYLLAQEGTWDNLPSNRLAGLRDRPCDLVVMHHHPAPYKDTSRFYERYPFTRHHHLMPCLADFQRLYRYMTGQAIGLVLSGGGLRGFAHYGLIKSLFECNIPIDYIGGSSMGAAIGALLAIDFNWDFFDKQFIYSMNALKKTKFIYNLTLPFVSIFSGHAVTKLIKKVFDQYKIEDLKTNFFCVTANLSTAEKEVITKGDLWEWLRASVALPGIMPPFEKKGAVYVDGGVCSNLPVGDMKTVLNHTGKVIAFNVQPPPFKGQQYQFPPVLSMKSMCLSLFGFKQYRYKYPSIIDICIESPLINQFSSDKKAAETADVMISPDTSSKSMAQSKNSDALIQPAYELAQALFLENSHLFKRWII
jgi:NTE family protein